MTFSEPTRRKKKKPTTFVPPPNLNMHQNVIPTSTDQNEGNVPNTGYTMIPFWRRPQTGGP